MGLTSRFLPQSIYSDLRMIRIRLKTIRYDIIKDYRRDEGEGYDYLDNLGL